MPIDMTKLVNLEDDKAGKAVEHGMIATVEESSTASRPYAIGERFYYTGKLYIATAPIASGGTITVSGSGQNCKLDVLGDDVSDLKTAIEYLNGADIWYVNGTTGSDSNDGLSSLHPFATIQKAVDTIGALKNETPNVNASACQAVIYVVEGEYDGFRVDGKNIFIYSNGTITINASSGVAIMLKNGANIVVDNPLVINQSGAYNAISINTASCLRCTKALTISNTSTAISVMCIADSSFIVNGALTVTATSTTGQCIYAQYNSRVSINGNSSAIDSTGTAIMCHTGSLCSIFGSLSISSNATIGLEVIGGIVIYRTITNNATTKEKTQYGGRIFTDTQIDLKTGVYCYNAVTSGTDLNDIKKSGIYRLRGTYTNAPDNSKWSVGSSNLVGNLFVLNAKGMETEESIVQILTIGAPFVIFYRTFTGASWYRWNAYGHNTYATLTNADLNSIKDTGIYVLDPTAYTYTHYPFGPTVKSVLHVIRSYADVDGVMQILYPKAYSISPLYRANVYANDVWIPFGKNNDTSIKVGQYNHPNYTPLTYNPQTAIKLKVGTINIGHFNYGDSSTFGIQTNEYDMKLHNWREYFCKQQFDFVNLNEYVPYIDPLAVADALTGTKLTTTYVLKPQFQYFDSTMDTDRKAAVIASRYPISNETEFALVGTTNNGYGRYYNVTIDENHVIGVYAIQMVFLSAPGDTYDSAASIANRKAQLDSLASSIGSNNDDYIVVFGDFNTGTSTDYTNVANFCSDNDLVPCNGGFLDWIRTYEASALCLDNILVSNNIHVNNFDSHSDWYGALSTDHYGISAEITLT